MHFNMDFSLRWFICNNQWGYVYPQYPTHVCRLNKSIYGLRQSPRSWSSRLSDKLVTMGFINSQYDTSLFVYVSNSLTMYVLVYVDDILITASNRGAITNLITQLNHDFAVKDLGPLHHFLGVKVTSVYGGILLSQRQYILNLLKRTNMLEAKPVSSPMSSSQQLSLFNGNPCPDETLFRSVVGALQYLSLTRPDISLAVNKVCQFMHKPADIHWTVVKRILHYLKFSSDFGLFIRLSSSTQLSVYSDADWAGSPDDHKSTSGYCIYYGHNLISWRSKKQPTVARSSTEAEAEYRAVDHATAETLWLLSLLCELQIFIPSRPVL